jgi:hypothetical protein
MKKQQKTVEKRSGEKFNFSKILIPVYLVIISCLFVANYNAIFDEKVDMNGDNIYYYSLGKALSDSKGYTNVIGFDETPHGHFPPGYPAFISMLMQTGISSIHAIKVTNGFLLYFSLLLLFFIFAKLSRNNIIAFVSTSFVACHSQLLRFATIMMSEMLFVFVTALIIFIVLEWNVKKAFSNRKKLLIDIVAICLLSASLAFLYFVRTMGVALIIAVLLYYGVIFVQYLIKTFKERKNADLFGQNKIILIKYAAICVVVLISLFAPKMAWDARNAKSLGKSGSDYANDFMKKGGGEKMTTFDDWKERLKHNSTAYITNYVPTAIFNSVPQEEQKATTGAWLKGLIFIVLMFLALFKSGQKGLLLLFYVGITFAVLVLYTEIYTGHRYMTPVMPFLIFLFLSGCFELINLLIVKLFKIKSGSKIYTSIISIAACAIFIFAVQPSYAQSFKDIKLQAKYKYYNQANATPSFLEFIQAAQWVQKNIPDSERVASRKPEIFYIFTDGRKCGGFPQYATPEEVIDGFEKNKINYVIIDWWFRHAYATVVPAIQQYPDKFRIVNQFGGANNQPATYVVEFLGEK